MSAYYNDHDPYCARWLRALVAGGHLAPGHVDGRSILDVGPDQLRAAEQVHLFAGIGGWPYALQLAGWDGPCWTASLPCQPLSSAGQQLGHADERHLWPAVYALIDLCRPATVFGEQVASRAGREWLAGVRADLEQLGYAVGASDLPAACVGAPHIRQRLFWVAHDTGEGRDGGSGPQPEEPAREGRLLADDGCQLDLLQWLADRGEPRLPAPQHAKLPSTAPQQKGRAAREFSGAPGRVVNAGSRTIRRRRGRGRPGARRTAAGA